MEIGIFSRTYETGNLDETYQKMTGHGIYHTQFNFSNVGIATLPTELSDETIRFIQQKNAEYDITIDAITGTFNMIDPNEEARKQGCAQFALQCRAAKELSIPIVTLCTGSKSPKGKWTWDDANGLDSSWDDLLRSTDQIIRYAEDNDVILGVETEASNIINTPLKARKYLDTIGSDNLKIIMDGANLFRPEQVPDMHHVLTEAFDVLGKDIVTAHAKDLSFDGNVAFVAAGQGILDFPYYIQLLKEHGYDGVITMHGLSEEQVPVSKSFLEALL